MSIGIVGRAMSMTLIGISAQPVLIEAVILPGLPRCSIVGLPDTAVNEARERLRASFSQVGLPWPQERLTINLSPGALPKTGTGLDLGLAIAILCAQGYRPLTKRAMAIGELGLDGSVRPVPGVLPSVVAAKENGLKTVLVPQENAHEAQLVDGVNIVPVAGLAQIAQWMETGITQFDSPGKNSLALPTKMPDQRLDMAEVYGQESALIATEVAVAGGHHMLMLGSPGVGKSMIAQRIPTVMPDLSADEAIEVAIIQSVQGQSCTALNFRPPLASPHHTASVAALIGGGSTIARPGAITAAHNGILFCDEFAEFSPRAIQALREPLETGYIDIARSSARVRFPARFQLIAAANPCKCGKALDGSGACQCTSRDLRSYQSRLGGPVRDRIDVVISLNRPTKADLNMGSTTTSARMRAKIECAQQRQYERQNVRNSQLSGSWLREHTTLSNAISALFDNRLRMGQLSMRGMDRILKLAWSVADINEHAHPTDDDVALAFSLRTNIEET
ncbi:YifB family Mg chelatase-like AAA ATPase [Arcanobacterium phocae]|uniref:YifB family Mg chelatase-like AAA ATPase n=1 Tax=Arcanobacterium phocae TaxID=131112 RepID=UPI001C0EDFE6|nr:YifB family Mg chelatase-like AAA ATPase [Arcanobacterium phocae]